MPLYLVGVNYEYLTLKAIEYIKSSDIVIIDKYTMPNSNKIISIVNDIAKEKKVILAERSMLEDNSYEIIDIAKEKKVSIVVLGDPLIATTHASLLIDAKKKKIEVDIVNGVSGICMVKSLSGLQYYKFGKTLTIPGPWRNLKPYSLIYNLYSNLCINAHTLLLFDIDDEGKTLSPDKGIEKILELNKELKLYEKLEKMLGIIIHIGEKNIFVGDSLYMLKDVKIEEPYSLIIPASLHYEEEDFLKYVLNISNNSIMEHKNSLKEDFCKYMLQLKTSIK
ncbi:MAG: diphthine synthase [Caldisphaera sp.]